MLEHSTVKLGSRTTVGGELSWRDPGADWDRDINRTAGATPTPMTGALLRHPLMGIIVRGARYKATSPVALAVERRGDHYFAENDTLDVCGYGPTAQAAVESAVKHLAYYFDHYLSINDDRLTADAIKLKRLYRNIFQLD